MALTQFNEWEPTLDAVSGRQAQEPRVFAHDAWPVVVGAINNTASNHGLNMTSGGTGYVVDEEITITEPTGTGHAPADKAIVVVTAVDASGAVTDYYIKVSGDTNRNYLLLGTADQVSSSLAGTGFTSTVSNIDIPNTQKRGCCLYVGNSGDLQVIMESGNTALFVGAATGAFLPILAKRIDIDNTTATIILALY